MIKNKSFTHGSDQWNAKIILYIGDFSEMNAFLLKKFRYEDNSHTQNPNFSGEAFTIINYDQSVVAHVIWMPEFSFKTQDYVTLTHEVIHTAARILDDRGVVYNDPAKEALTYTVDNIYGAFLKKLHQEYDKDGR